MLVLLVFAAPLIGAYVTYKFWRPTATVNYGELIRPTAVPEDQLRELGGAPFSLSGLQGKWVLVSVDSAACDAPCERKLYLMRQLRVALGKNTDRVERLWLIDDQGEVAAKLKADFAGTAMVRALGAPALNTLAAPGSLRDHLFIIDPIGNVMMRYPKDPDPKGIMRDLNRLLKVSHVG